MLTILNWLEKHQIIAASLINVMAIIVTGLLTTYLNSRFDIRRENDRWTREKLYELYSQATASFTKLLQAVSGNQDPRDIARSYYGLQGALSDLSQVCREQDTTAIESIKSKVEATYINQFIQKDRLPELEAGREELNRLRQNEQRLKELFNN